MSKSLYITEKPSVAQEFANALRVNGRRSDGYIESGDAIITWCVGHLVTMSYPEAYDPKYKRWSLETLPFLPREFKYEIIPSVAKQFRIVSGLLNRPDVDTIYICTDSGREGEYIYRLVDQMAGVHGKRRKRVWIDSQTEEEILRGIREAKDWTEYDNLSASAYLRAKEDYLMGINFSRLLTLKYGPSISSYLRTDRTVLSVGRVMTCVLGMVVRREREIRGFVKTPFYRVLGTFGELPAGLEGEWRAVPGSRYYQSPYLYKENGFKERKRAEELIAFLRAAGPGTGTLTAVERKKETKNPPLLYNLAELQNDCSKMFKISPDETLKIVQELYEKKLVTYPRTDARVLSTAVAKEITRNLSGLKACGALGAFAAEILENGSFRGLEKTRYVNDKQITDHYAIIPTGQGLGALRGLKGLSGAVYEVIVRRFLSIFYPPAVYQKVSLEVTVPTGGDGGSRTAAAAAETAGNGAGNSPAPESRPQAPASRSPGEPAAPPAEHFFASYRLLVDPGYLKVATPPGRKKPGEKAERDGSGEGSENGEKPSPQTEDPAFRAWLGSLKKGAVLPLSALAIKEGETSPPKRYTSGSMILAMENAGQLIEDEELRAQIKGSGIGTSATRAEILKKLVNIKYLALNGKTQVITPTLLGEIVFDTVDASIRQLLNPELTASWEKGLTYVAEGSITSEEYMEKLEKFVAGRTLSVLKLRNQYDLRTAFDAAAVNYKK
ncbi:DNA topoisomerase [Lachnoclostridium sp. An14]|uniref:DNA topoisomerase n=1 Tax=Lachnoclostridium sp. An14 TaxID=1965562 RepID=UPI001FA8FC7B|nr:DNA topoisomerase [Lachnoclostridium sp. An14]